ncbi:hypothetical protein K457DRAFT_37395, partial [Linnemannia elongata AG-77]
VTERTLHGVPYGSRRRSERKVLLRTGSHYLSFGSNIIINNNNNNYYNSNNNNNNNNNNHQINTKTIKGVRDISLRSGRLI